MLLYLSPAGVRLMTADAGGGAADAAGVHLRQLLLRGALQQAGQCSSVQGCITAGSLALGY
jgi:hypothetical protein